MYSKEQYMEKIENREINVSDLFKYNIKQWKKIVSIAMVIFALLLVGIFFKYKMNGQKESAVVSMAQLSAVQQKNVKNVLELYEELDDIQDYITNSSYMAINAYNGIIYNIQYFVSASNTSNAYNAYQIYTNYIKNGAMKEEIEIILGDRVVNSSELVELVIDKDDKQPEEIKSAGYVINIKINAPDEDISSELVEIVKQKLNEYKQTVVGTLAGDHELRLLSENNYTGLDDSVQAKQENVKDDMNNKRNHITILENQMTDEEKLVLEQEKLKLTGQEVAVGTSSRISAPVLLVLALIASFVSVICFFSIYYFTNNKLKNKNEIARYFDIPYIGTVKNSPDFNKTLCKEIEMLCKAKNVKEVSISCLEPIPEQINLKKILMDAADIKIDIIDNICNSVTAIGCKNLIITVKYNFTSYGAIVELIQKCEYLNINVIGAINIE